MQVRYFLSVFPPCAGRMSGQASPRLPLPQGFRKASARLPKPPLQEKPFKLKGGTGSIKEGRGRQRKSGAESERKLRAKGFLPWRCRAPTHLHWQLHWRATPAFLAGAPRPPARKAFHGQTWPGSWHQRISSWHAVDKNHSNGIAMAPLLMGPEGPPKLWLCFSVVQVHSHIPYFCAPERKRGTNSPLCIAPRNPGPQTSSCASGCDGWGLALPGPGDPHARE